MKGEILPFGGMASKIVEAIRIGFAAKTLESKLFSELRPQTSNTQSTRSVRVRGFAVAYGLNKLWLVPASPSVACVNLSLDS